MRVTLTKDGDFCLMRVDGHRGPELLAQRSPGGDAIPHDVGHLLVEVEFGIRGGVFGRVARMKSTFFPLADSKDQVRHARRMKKWSPSQADRADMARSEHLTSIGEALLAQKVQGRTVPPDWFSRFPRGIEHDPDVVRVVDRLEEFYEQWKRLVTGESVVIDWPAAPKP